MDCPRVKICDLVPKEAVRSVYLVKHIALMEAILCFIMPLHSRLQLPMQDTVFICEEAKVRATEQVVVYITDLLLYDNSEEYDNGVDYDTGATLTIYV